MDNLYYSPKEKMVFWIVGYVDFSITHRRVPSVQIYAERFQKRLGAKEVKTKIIKSAGYKGKRLYFASMDRQPVGAFNIGEQRDMDNWLSQ
ncbi:MAG: hypothetical protein DBP02_19730 [gamma proteobacterium symbiont of Ctena orbiculata]|nr:MAG: hypothetical protein DBP02_19730 [gamma proteobacterium symbiont of Ctena orbiculata]